MPEDFASLLDRLEVLSSEIRDRQRPFAILGEEGYGFEPTPLESELRVCAGEIACCLEESPALLTTANLERVLRALLMWQPAIRGERVRLIASGGDYDDIMSPLAGVALNLFAALRQTLQREACSLAYPLASADPGLLRRRMSLEREWSLLDLLTVDPEA